MIFFLFFFNFLGFFCVFSFWGQFVGLVGGVSRRVGRYP